MITQAWNIVFLCIATLYSTNAQITGWVTPLINAESGPGTLTFPDDTSVGTTSTTLEATPTGSDTIASYTLLTTTGIPFSVDSTTGAVSLDSALNFETTPTYTIEVRAVDSADTPNSATATITITVTNANTAPTFASSVLTACVADGSTEGQSVTTLTSTDPDAGDTIAYSITTGDTSNHFKFSGAELQVNTGITLDMATTPSYTLGIRATDDASETGDTILTVTVGSCSSATVLGISIIGTLMALVVSLY